MSKKSPKIRVTRTGRRLVFILAFFLGICNCFISCNLTRKVTTESSFFQRGDTTTTITTKTIESYDATKKSL